MANQSPTTITTEDIWLLAPFARFLDVTFPILTSERVVAKLPPGSEYTTVGGGVHGGALMALSDIAAAVMAVLAGGDPSASPATVQSSTNFLRPARGTVTATATVLRGGRTTVIDVTLSDETGATSAEVRQVVAVRRPKTAS